MKQFFRQQERPRGASISFFTWARLLIYALVLAYLGCDLFWLKGPLWQQFYETAPEAQQQKQGEERLLAVVAGEAIRRKDLRYELEKILWQQGKEYTQLSERRRFELRQQALQNLVVKKHLRILASARELKVDLRAVAEEYALLERAWGGKELTKQRLAALGWTPQQVMAEIEAEQLGALYIEDLLAAELAAIGEEEARQWYELHENSLIQARRARFGQVFLATLHRDSAEVLRQLEQLRAQAEQQGQDGMAAALAASEDERSKQNGGSLGLIAFPMEGVEVEFLPAGVREELASMQFGEDKVFASDLGWHWVWMESDWEEPRQILYEEMEVEIIAFLRQQEREKQVEAIHEGIWLKAKPWLDEQVWLELPVPLPSLPDPAKPVNAPAMLPPEVESR